MGILFVSLFDEFVFLPHEELGDIFIPGIKSKKVNKLSKSLKLNTTTIRKDRRFG